MITAMHDEMQQHGTLSENGKHTLCWKHENMGGQINLYKWDRLHYILIKIDYLLIFVRSNSFPHMYCLCVGIFMHVNTSLLGWQVQAAPITSLWFFFSLFSCRPGRGVQNQYNTTLIPVASPPPASLWRHHDCTRKIKNAFNSIFFFYVL